jgi:hypothetical protein
VELSVPTAPPGSGDEAGKIAWARPLVATFRIIPRGRKTKISPLGRGRRDVPGGYVSGGSTKKPAEFGDSAGWNVKTLAVSAGD